MRQSSSTTLLLIRPQGSRRTYREPVNANVPLAELLQGFLLKRFRVTPRYIVASAATAPTKALSDPLDLARTPAELGFRSQAKISLYWGTSMRDEAAVHIAAPILAQTARHLRKAAMYGVEGVCYWAAEWHDDRWNVTTLVRPRTVVATAVRVDVSAEENMRVEAALSSDAAIIAQVHSHLGPAFHSDRDDHYPYSLEPGFLSIVVPHGAHDAVDWPGSLRVFELQEYPRWREWTKDETSRRFMVTETFATTETRVSSRSYMAIGRHQVATSTGENGSYPGGGS